MTNTKKPEAPERVLWPERMWLDDYGEVRRFEDPERRWPRYSLDGYTKTIIAEQAAKIAELEKERDEARAQVQFMFNRVADERLDGYRELGQRAAAAENKADELRALAKLLKEKLRLRGYMYDEEKEACRKLGVL